MDILGADFSNQKLRSHLGVEEEELMEALREENERQETKIRQLRRNSDTVDRKHNSKALEVLGHNPSKEKAMNILGMDKHDIQQYEKQEKGMKWYYIIPHMMLMWHY